MPVEHIRLSQQAKDHLARLKRWTGLRHWNELCRWAFCVSLADQTPPAAAKIPADSNVEIEWKVFAGPYNEIYWALLKERCRRDGLDVSEETLAVQFRLHLHRGIGHLAADKELRTVSGLFERVPACDTSER